MTETTEYRKNENKSAETSDDYDETIIDSSLRIAQQ